MPTWKKKRFICTSYSNFLNQIIILFFGTNIIDLEDIRILVEKRLAQDEETKNPQQQLQLLDELIKTRTKPNQGDIKLDTLASKSLYYLLRISFSKWFSPQIKLGNFIMEMQFFDHFFNVSIRPSTMLLKRESYS